MTQQLPTPGGDVGTWGYMLNGYLGVSLNADGTMQTGAVSAAGAEMTSNKGAASGYAPLNSSSQVPIANIPTGTNSSTVAIGNDSRITGALQASNNLSDVSSASSARTSLGLGSAATQNTSTFLQVANNFSDVADAGSARANIHTPALTPAACVAVNNVSSLSGLGTYDGYTLNNNDLILLAGQTTASQNGLWLTPASGSGSWTRPTEFASGLVIHGRSVIVLNGTSYGATTWALKAPTAGITVDTSSQTWSNSTYAALPNHGPYLGVFFNQPLGGTTNYVGTPYEAAYVYRSGDGYDFIDSMPNPVLYASPGLRDMSVIRVGDTWFMAATNASNASLYTSSFPIYKSTDLLNWTLVTTVSMSTETGATTPEAWGPYLYQDPVSGNIYVFVYISGSPNTSSTIWWLQATDTTGLTTWSSPTQVTTNSLPSGTQIISDTAIMYNAGSSPGPYHIFFTDDTHTYILHATASSPTGPWTVIQSGNWLGLGVDYEAPIIIQVGPAKWRLYTDNWSSLGYGWMETTDPTLQSGWSTWKQLTWNGVATNGHFRHGTVIPLTSIDQAGAALAASQPLVNTPGAVIGFASYGSAGGYAWTTTSTSLAAMTGSGAPTATVTFVAPASGLVEVELYASVKLVTSGTTGYWGLVTHGTSTAVTGTGQQGVFTSTVANQIAQNVLVKFYVSGLTAGLTYSWDWAQAVSVSADTFETFGFASSSGLPYAVMKVTAVP